VRKKATFFFDKPVGAEKFIYIINNNL